MLLCASAVLTICCACAKSENPCAEFPCTEKGDWRQTEQGEVLLLGLWSWAFHRSAINSYKLYINRKREPLPTGPWLLRCKRVLSGLKCEVACNTFRGPAPQNSFLPDHRIGPRLIPQKMISERTRLWSEPACHWTWCKVIPTGCGDGVAWNPLW